MAITFNPIGNYGNLRTNSVQRKNPVSVETSKEELITNTEKKFFADKYPDNKEEIQFYHAYQKNGHLTGVSIGTLVNRRA